MSIKAATPYLVLSGQAEEAIAFYEKALGAKVETLMRFGDADSNCPESQKDWVMHSALRVGDATIFLSDGQLGPAKKGGPVHVALDLDSAAQARGIFDALAAGGEVGQALFEAPWGSLFGALVDRYGIGWFFNSTTT